MNIESMASFGEPAHGLPDRYIPIEPMQLTTAIARMTYCRMASACRGASVAAVMSQNCQMAVTPLATISSGQLVFFFTAVPPHLLPSVAVKDVGVQSRPRPSVTSGRSPPAPAADVSKFRRVFAHREMAE